MNSILTFQDTIVRVFILAVPVIVGGVLHMVAVKGDVLSYLKIPIHQRWFGQNKTWRGFLIMPLLTWPGVWLAQKIESIADLNAPLIQAHPSWLLALILGLSYCLAELPNSFVKRRLGVKEGKTSENNKWLFIIVDQSDSVIGCLLGYMILIPISGWIFLVTVILGAGVHLAINILLFQVGLRKNPY